MGAHCCVAARSSSSGSGTGINVSTVRNDANSPSWSFRWDNRTHIEESVDSRLSLFSCGNSGNIAGSEIKSPVDTEPEGISDGEFPFNSFGSSAWHKSPSLGTDRGNTFKGGERDLSIGSASSTEEKEIKQRPITRRSFTFSPSSSMSKADPSSSHTFPPPSNQTSMRKIHGSPNYHMSRQASDGHMSLVGSQSENSPSEGIQSFASFPSYANVLSIGGGSNDGGGGGGGGSSSENSWSVRLFSDLIAYSQRERWSFDGDNYHPGYGRSSKLSCQSLASPAGMQKCGVCSKLLKERSPWGGRKLVSNEVPVAAVLICGHVYHGDCLEKATSDVERFDPSCPVCTNGGKYLSMSRSLGKVDPKSRSKKMISLSSLDFDSESTNDLRKDASSEGKGSKLGASCSIKTSNAKPFMKRHFSIGSRAVQPSSENEDIKKKGFFWFKRSS